MPNFFDQFDSAPAQDAPKNAYAGAISSIESSGRYDLVGPATRTGDRALGKYQVMSANVPEWTKEALGQSLTPQQFLADPKAQDVVFQHQFGKYVQKYGPEGAARAWFAGEGGMNDPNRRDVLGTSVADYSNKFTKALGFAPQQQAPQGLPPAIANGQSAQPATSPAQPKNFFDQFDEQPQQAQPVQQPSTVQRADIPEGITRITVGGVQGNGLAAQPPKPDNFAQILTDFTNQGLAAGQRTTPNIAAQSKNLLSTDVQEGDDGNAYFVDPTNGGLQQVDTAKHVVLRDPADGRLKVYGRTDNTNEGMLSSAGRLLGTGLAAGAPVSRAIGPATQVAQELKPGQQVVAAADRLSQTGAPVQVPRAVATDNMATQRAAAIARNIPFAGDPLVQSAERTIGQLGNKAAEVAQGFGGSNVAGSGESAREAIKNYITSTSAATSKKFYDRVDDLVDNSVKTDLSATRAAANSINAKRSNAAISEASGAVKRIQTAIDTPGGLNYEGVKDLRTYVGELKDGNLLPADISQKELSRIYSALSVDLRSAVLNAGGSKAVSAFERANKHFSLISNRREALAKIIGKDGNAPAEQVFERLVSMASSSGRADIAKLYQARKAIGRDDWNEFVSGIIGRMGRDTASFVGPEKLQAEGFSPQRFLTAYGKLSPAGKSVLFRSGDKSGLASHLEDIAKVSTRFKELQKFSNPSGTGQTVFGGSIGTGLIIDPLSTAMTVLGGRVLASVLSRPASAASLAKVAKAQQALVMSPSPARLSAFNTATRNLISTIGARNLTPADFLKAVQGTVQSRAQDEQQ